MVIVEYRIPMPMSASQYRIGQLYMIQSTSKDSSVEIIKNEPYSDGWLKYLVPKSLYVEEEAWNAYPYTKTVYKCPFLSKFSLHIESHYLDNDLGTTENIFGLSEEEKLNSRTELVDICDRKVRDYHKEEDPLHFTSPHNQVTPLREDWLKNVDPSPGMCAYKLCRVNFDYSLIRGRAENYIQAYGGVRGLLLGVRETILRAHRQAWCWQDEYRGLTIEDIRDLEETAQKSLAERKFD
ncbi:protein retinal degeneration B-like [Octopus sinensis]|uniref:Protein retinal degeneration B-like n=1 Tax=Octopus sinensis TaxID=2607531 RepID=A0A7E6EJ57_9MOLL|nr:protein retinal degeneration B-like [Octopus sinensis]